MKPRLNCLVLSILILSYILLASEFQSYAHFGYAELDDKKK